MTSELIERVAGAISETRTGNSLSWRHYVAEAQAAIQVIAPAVLDAALTRLEWALTEGADPILAVRAVKKGYGHD